MENKASITALMSAFVRAYHTESTLILVYIDNMARCLFTDEEYAQMKAYICSGADFFENGLKESGIGQDELLRRIINTHLAPTPVARARFCADSLKTALLTGTQQYVILGAGYDMSAWDIHHNNIKIFELDHPDTQAEKKKRILRAGLEIPPQLSFVPVDFTADSIKDRLLAAGFDVTKKTFFSWLGVSFYLTEAEIRKLLADISSFAAEGSTLVFDYADSGFFSSGVKRIKNMIAMAAAGGEPMRFACDSMQLAKILEDNSFLIYEELTPEDINFNYFNISDMTAAEHINYVTAVLKGTERINTKEKILNIALRMFAKRGYDSVSVRDIAGELGITQAALYKHYKNKRDIFDSILHRMEENDGELAENNNMLSDSVENAPQSYKTELEDIKKFSLDMFRCWTGDAFASAFRRMLTIEQYKSAEMSALYNQYLLLGPLTYVEDLFRKLGCKNAGKNALAFYSHIFTLINMYDTAEDKREVESTAKAYIENFEFME